MTTFSIDYRESYSASIEFETQVNEKQLGREQRYPKKIYPIRTFTLKFDKEPTARAALEAFFDSVEGNNLFFDWTWETSKGGNGITYTNCWFESESLKESLHHLGFLEDCELKIQTIDRNAVTPVSYFDFYYDTQYKYSKIWKTLLDKVITAANNRRKILSTPKQKWELVFQKDPTVRKQIEDFFISKRGRFKAFQWTWELDKGGDGNTYWVRFDTDKLDFDTYLGYVDSITIPIKEVWAQIPAPTEELEKDEIIPRRLLFLDIPGNPVRVLDNETLASLTYGGETYLGAPLEVGQLKKSDETEVSKVNVSVSNVNQGISAIIGNSGDIITGCDCYLYQVFLNTSTFSLVSGVDTPLFAGRANNLVMNEQSASMDIETTLGGFDKSAPVMSYGVSCQWSAFKDERCGYTGDQTSCDRTLTTCKRYGNLENFSGFPSLPCQQVIKA